MAEKQHKIILGITGASGALYARLLLEKIAALENQVEQCAVIFSANARQVWKYELEQDPDQITWSSRFILYNPGDFFAPPASGSAGYDTMIICPCTMGTLGRIAAGVAGDLMTRAADVMLKERGKLILVPRETPFNLIHLNNMKLLTEAGAIICPASPSFYGKPSSTEQLAVTVIDRVLSLAGFDFERYHWGE